ncbi:lysylphosphatidylglycerol synthase transmembrane domain-containing protein [uncultured Tenacibaculum sp.]|uniref:lysylphosphatidylglycerol synthase transmembrane domain-containing protein n=1 Tax=uncultured Tenacibaculum sp. TaxID=174713 RepID=UPI002639AD87|nr:lysylphosphatidylglycerol synthase transmembrane domain-containing protein [uncultured Tenacibaculum sp.]
MNTSQKKILKIILPLVLGGFLVWYSLSRMDKDKMIDYLETANYGWIALGLFFGILSHLSRAYRWKFLLQPMGYKPKLGNSILAVLVGYFVNLAIPRAGEVSRATVMTTYEDIPFEKGFGTIVAERIADLVMMFLIIGITLLIQFEFIYNLVAEKFDPIVIGGGLVILVVVFLIVRSYVKKASSGIGLKIKHFLNSLTEGLTSIFKMKDKWSFIFHTVFIWTMYVAMFWATIPALENFSVPLGAVLVGFIAGGFSIAATNGGIGSYPLAVAGAFMLFGVEKDPSEAFGWIMWSAQTAMIIIFGGLSFFILPIFNKNK